MNLRDLASVDPSGFHFGPAVQSSRTGAARVRAEVEAIRSRLELDPSIKEPSSAEGKVMAAEVRVAIARLIESGNR